MATCNETSHIPWPGNPRAGIRGQRNSTIDIQNLEAGSILCKLWNPIKSHYIR